MSGQNDAHSIGIWNRKSPKLHGIEALIKKNWFITQKKETLIETDCTALFTFFYVI